MGAQTFMFTVGAESVKDAYKKAVERAFQKYGNDRYNGSISTTSGVQEFKWKPSTEFPTVESYADYLINKKAVQKWGNAGCILVQSDKVNTYLLFGWAAC